MVSVVLDTNVLVASLIKPRGPNRDVLRVLLGNLDAFEICYSPQMMAEYEDVLARPVITGRGLAENANRLLGLIIRVGKEIIPRYVPALVYPDPKDRPFLEAAVYVDGLLVTNNLKDYPFVGVAVLGPEEFLGWWKDRGELR